MSQYFPKPYEPFGADINVKVDLSNYVTKADIKNISHVDISNFALKANLASLKTGVDKLDIDKLVSVPVDLSKLSNVIKNDVVKKGVYNKLVVEVNNIDTSGFVLKTKYDTDKSELENNIPDTSGLVKKIDYKAKTTEIEGKTPDISNLATKTALTTIENKIPSVSNLATKTALTSVENEIPDINSLVKKANYNTKISSLDSRIAKINSDIKEFSRKSLLLFWGNIMFNSEDGSPAYLISQPLYRYFKTVTNTNYILSWKSRGLCTESIKPHTTSDNSLTPELSYHDYSIRVKFT